MIFDESAQLEAAQQQPAASNAANAKGAPKRRALQAMDGNQAQFQRQTRSKSGASTKNSTEEASLPSKRGGKAPEAAAPKAENRNEERSGEAPQKASTSAQHSTEEKVGDSAFSSAASSTRHSTEVAVASASAPARSGAASEHDIDSVNNLDELMVAEYAGDIYKYLKENEARSVVNPSYMLRQSDINAKMRVILNDWLVEVHLKFKLRQETLYLCFQIIDRFLERQLVARSRLQLVGVTGLMLASKYEEIYPPEVRDYVYICDNAYTREQILEMEKLILAKLEFRLSLPTVWSWMRRFTKAAGRETDPAFFNLVSYVIDLSMIDLKMLKYTPSHLVATAVLAALRIQKDTKGWTACLAHHTGYVEAELLSCAEDVRGLMEAAPLEARCKAVYKKYSHVKFDEVAMVPFEHAFPAPNSPASSASIVTAPH